MERRQALSLKDITKLPGKLFRLAALPALLAASLNSPVFAQGNIVGQYWQCGGEIEGKTVPDDHTVAVYLLGDGTYNPTDLGPIAGKCGSTFEAPDDFITALPDDSEGIPVSVGDSEGNTYLWSGRYLQCGGPLGPMVFKPGHTVRVDVFTNPNHGDRYAVRNFGPQPGQCGNPA